MYKGHSDTHLTVAPRRFPQTYKVMNIDVCIDFACHMKIQRPLSIPVMLYKYLIKKYIKPLILYLIYSRFIKIRAICPK